MSLVSHQIKSVEISSRLKTEDLTKQNVSDPLQVAVFLFIPTQEFAFFWAF